MDAKSDFFGQMAENNTQTTALRVSSIALVAQVLRGAWKLRKDMLSLRAAPWAAVCRQFHVHQAKFAKLWHSTVQAASFQLWLLRQQQMVAACRAKMESTKLMTLLARPAQT